jgi:hypothetical protein
VNFGSRLRGQQSPQPRPNDRMIVDDQNLHGSAACK